MGKHWGMQRNQGGSDDVMTNVNQWVTEDVSLVSESSAKLG